MSEGSTPQGQRRCPRTENAGQTGGKSLKWLPGLHRHVTEGPGWLSLRFFSSRSFPQHLPF